MPRLVLKLADDIVAAPKLANEDLDINIVRALLYMERRDPRIDQRIRQYLNGRQLTPLAHQAVAALDPNTGEDRAFEIITSLGKLIWTVEKSALVFAIDQVEDLRFFDDAEERFQKAVRDLIQIANRLTNAIVIISCLDDFYGQVRGALPQSYLDRIEKSGPVALLESRTPEEARLIIARRLQHEAEAKAAGLAYPDPTQFFGPQFFEEFGGLSTRRLLEHAQIAAARKSQRRTRGSRRRGRRQLGLHARVRSRQHLWRRLTRRRNLQPDAAARLSRDVGALPERVRGGNSLRRSGTARHPHRRSSTRQGRVGGRHCAGHQPSGFVRRCARDRSRHPSQEDGPRRRSARVPLQPKDTRRRPQASAR